LENSKKYIHGIAIIGSAIQRLKRGNSLNCSDNTFPSKVVVNFGGSSQALTYLMKLNSIIGTRIDIQFVIFCSKDVYLDLETFLCPHENATVKCVGDEYFTEMVNCDLLVTSSGSSFLEAIYMNIPTAIFDLFENASLNFEAFRLSSNVLYAGQIEDLDRDWFAEMSLNYKKNKTVIDKNRFEEQFHFIDIDTLKCSIGPILQKSAARH
jgi:spore coat polysaccharide biosynthesis predicted glycosyltransferase SpsG